MATGLKIQEKEINISEFEVATPEEAFKKFVQIGAGEEMSVENIVGELRLKGGGPMITFLRNLPQDTIGGVLVTGTIADMLGPTFLFSQAAVDRGDYNDFLTKVEENFGKDKFPRLANNGKAKPNAD